MQKPIILCSALEQFFGLLELYVLVHSGSRTEHEKAETEHEKIDIVTEPTETVQKSHFEAEFYIEPEMIEEPNENDCIVYTNLYRDTYTPVTRFGISPAATLDELVKKFKSNLKAHLTPRAINLLEVMMSEKFMKEHDLSWQFKLSNEKESTTLPGYGLDTTTIQEIWNYKTYPEFDMELMPFHSWKAMGRNFQKLMRKQ